MISAPNKNYCDYCDISEFWRAPWHVTAELNEMVQYQEEQKWLGVGRCDIYLNPGISMEEM